MIKIEKDTKEIVFKNIAQDDILKNDGPHVIEAAIHEMDYLYKYQFKIYDNNALLMLVCENNASYTTINSHNYTRVYNNNYETINVVCNFWNKIKQGEYHFLDIYNPKYNRYVTIHFNEIKTIQKRK